MAAKRKQHFYDKLFDVIAAIPALFRFMCGVTAIIKRDIQTAGKRMQVLALLSVLAFSILTCSWLCIVAMLFLFFVSLHLSGQIALFLILILNLLVFMLLIIIMTKLKKNILFPETCDLIDRVYKNDNYY